MVEKAAEAAEAAQREAAQWKEKFTQTTNKISQLEQKVRGRPGSWAEHAPPSSPLATHGECAPLACTIIPGPPTPLAVHLPSHNCARPASNPTAHVCYQVFAPVPDCPTQHHVGCTYLHTGTPVHVP